MSDDAVVLARALRARGFELTVDLVLTDAGPRKIEIIKAVRGLTWVGLKEAKDLVDARGVVLRGVPLPVAESAAATFADADARTRMVVASATLIAFDPAHPEGPAQPVERLHVDAAARSLSHDHGRLDRLDCLEPGPPVAWADPEQLLQRIDDKLDAWAASGWRVVGRALTVVEQFAARDLAAERRLRAASVDQRRAEAEVYGDWLQARGDVRGRLAALTLAPASDAGAAELARLLEDHALALFGPTPARASARTWLGPVLDAVELQLAPSGRLGPHSLIETLSLPVHACLRELALVHPLADVRTLLPIIGVTPCAPGLRALRLDSPGPSSISGVELAAWRAASLAAGDPDRSPFEQLERLELRGNALELSPATLPSVRTLVIETRLIYGRLAPRLESVELPALEHLELRVAATPEWIRTNPPTPTTVVVLRFEGFTRLRSLTLTGLDVALGPGLVSALTEAARLPALERIDLRGAALEPATAAELEAARGRLPGLVLPGDP